MPIRVIHSPLRRNPDEHAPIGCRFCKVQRPMDLAVTSRPPRIDKTHGPTWDADFSLALFNRTGKFHIGRDVLQEHPARFGRTYFWRYPAAKPPSGLTARMLGKLEAIERKWRLSGQLGTMRAGRSARPMLHFDPLTVLHRDLESCDMIVCHDLGPLTHPDLFPDGTKAAYGAAFERIAHSQARLIFVSQATAREHQRMFGPARFRRVIYPPIRDAVRSGYVEVVQGLPERFLLSVGSIGRRKNQRRAIEAFTATGLAEAGIGFVICGAHEPGAEEIIDLSRNIRGVTCLHFVADAQLRWLYQNAVGFVLPSLLEGFGMPVAEAMQNGLVPIVSRDSVLEEVAGDCGIAVDPLSVESIAAGMIACIDQSPANTAERRSRMADQLARFSAENFHDGWAEALAS